MTPRSPFARLFWRVFGLLALAAAWAYGHAVYGPFVLPRPDAAAAELLRLFASGAAGAAIASTAGQALAGWRSRGCVGLALAFAGNRAAPVALSLRPLATMLLGVPPVAWIVLALLWFGPEGSTPAFTVAVTVAPLVFAAALQGLAARDAALDEMAHAFQAPLALRVTDIVAPQLLAQLSPALAAALGFAWKVCVMAEVMTSGTGIGGQLALARAHLDLTQAMAWILLIVLLVLASDVALLAPLRRWAVAAGGATFVPPSA